MDASANICRRTSFLLKKRDLAGQPRPKTPYPVNDFERRDERETRDLPQRRGLPISGRQRARYLDPVRRVIHDLASADGSDLQVLTVLIADDHALLRAGLRLAMRLGPAQARFLETGNGRDAVTLAERERPDLAVLDIGMPGLNGIDAAALIVAAVPSCKVVILSVQADDQQVTRAFRAGVSGYILKNGPVSELTQALEAVQHGEKYVSPGISAVVASQVMAGGPLGASPLDGLTPRQREVLQRIAEGASTKEIAHALDLSAKTVDVHRRQIMERLRIYDVASLVRFALRVGLIDPE
jgi:DNA-binding NarL/FixJ family response regulator